MSTSNALLESRLEKRTELYSSSDYTISKKQSLSRFLRHSICAVPYSRSSVHNEYAGMKAAAAPTASRRRKTSKKMPSGLEGLDRVAIPDVKTSFRSLSTRLSTPVWAAITPP
jgi:hypothetical protein